MEVDLSPALDRLPYRRLVVNLERHHLSLQVFSDLLYQAFKKKLLRSGSATLRHSPRRTPEQLALMLQELYLRRLDGWLLRPERLVVAKQQPRKKGAPRAPSRKPVQALRPLRLGGQLLLLMRANEDSSEVLSHSVRRWAEGDLALKVNPRAFHREALPKALGGAVDRAPEKAPQLLGFKIFRSCCRPGTTSITFERDRLLSRLAKRGLLRKQRGGRYRADS